jgi:hypothetical protein
MLTFDHLKLVQRNPRELKRFRRYLMGVQPGEAALTEVNVVHEHDDACCHAEPWDVTLATICQTVRPPARLAFLNLLTGL